MANVHVLASIPNCIFLEHKVTDVPWRLDVAPGAVPEEDGYIRVPDAPGLGVDIDDIVAAKHPIREVGDFTYNFRSPEEILKTATD